MAIDPIRFVLYSFGGIFIFAFNYVIIYDYFNDRDFKRRMNNDDSARN